MMGTCFGNVGIDVVLVWVVDILCASVAVLDCGCCGQGVLNLVFVSCGGLI